MDESDRLIDAVLDTYPLEPLPPGFTTRVMAQVRGVSPRQLQQQQLLKPQPVPTFRLDFVDFALPLFFALCSAGMMALGLYATQALDPLTRLKLELQAKILLAQMFALPSQLASLSLPVAVWLPVLAACAVTVLGLGIGLGVWAVQRPVRLVEK